MQEICNVNNIRILFFLIESLLEIIYTVLKKKGIKLKNVVL